jgi:hypothetical protein
MIARRSNQEVLPPCASGLFFFATVPGPSVVRGPGAVRAPGADPAARITRRGAVRPRGPP